MKAVDDRLEPRHEDGRERAGERAASRVSARAAARRTRSNDCVMKACLLGKSTELWKAPIPTN